MGRFKEESDGLGNLLERFTYVALPSFYSFRTLELSPGTGNEPLRGRLQVHTDNLMQADDGALVPVVPVRYEALSYVWGDATLSHRLLVSGNKYMAITANLHAALRRFRLPDHPRVLWADGCCINQADPQEKSRQVKQMAGFYQHAERVLVYLGDEADGSEKIPSLLDTILTALSALRLQPDDIQPHMRFVPPGLPPKDDEAWLALGMLFLRPWWTRCWIIQEVAIGATVELACGGWSMDWERFVAANRAAQHVTKPVMPPGHEGVDLMHERTHALKTAEASLVSLSKLRKSLVRKWFPLVMKQLDGTTKQMMLHQYRPTWRLIDILDLCRYAQASVDHDYIYALLGLCEEDADGLFEKTSGPVLAPDYAEPVARTFTRYARHMVEWGDAIKLLYSAASHGLGLRDDLASWVPNWSARGGPPHVLSPRDDGGVTKYYTAASGFQPNIVLHETRDELQIQGVMIGRIARVGAVAPPPGPVDAQRFTSVIGRDMQTVVAAADDIVRFLASDPRTSPPHLEHVWRTLCCDVDTRSGREIRQVDPVGMAQCFDAMRSIGPLWFLLPGFGKHPGEEINDDAVLLDTALAVISSGEEFSIRLEQAQEFLMRTAPYCLGRRVAVLDDGGRPAQIPPSSEPGDVVFLPFGSAIPFVFRELAPSQDGEAPRVFRVVGECYVHDAMDGMIPLMRKMIESVVLV